MADGGHGLVLMMMMMMTKPCSRSGVGFQGEKGIAVCDSVAANDWISNRWKMLTMEDICYLEHHGGELVVVQDKRLQLKCRR